MTKHIRLVTFVFILACLLVSIPAFAAENNDKKDEGKQESSEPRWGDFTLAPKIGYAYYQNLRNNTTIPGRHSMLIQLDFDMGGPGSGFIFAPYYAMQTAKTTIFGKVRMHTLGADFGMRYAFKAGNAFPYIGLQTKLGYIFNNDLIDHGVELFGRLPLGLTYYILEDLGIVIETCIAYGTTITKGGPGVLGTDWNWGHGLYTDVSVGIRWP